MAILMILCLGLQAIICFKLLKSPMVSMVLSISIASAVFLWYFLPGSIAVAYSYDAVGATLYDDLTDAEFTSAYLCESGAMCLILAAFLMLRPTRMQLRRFLMWIVRKPSAFTSHQICGPRSGDHSQMIIFLVLFAYLAFLIFQIATGTFAYLDRNSGTMYDVRAGGGLVAVVSTLLFSATVFVFLISPRKSVTLYLAFFLLCVGSATSVAAGGRIGLVTPLVVIAFRCIRQEHIGVHALVSGLVVFVVAIFVVLPLASGIGRARQAGVVDMADVMHSLTDRRRSSEYLEMLFQKFDSFSAGASLLKSGGGFGYAGIKPYYGSALVFIPRFVWSERPVSGSVDGSIQGHPSRIVPQAQGVISDAYNVGVSPLCISVWQLGIAGIGVFICSAIAFLLFMNYLLLSPSVVSRVIGISLLSIPSFHLLWPSPDVILRQAVIALTLLGVCLLCRHMHVQTRLSHRLLKAPKAMAIPARWTYHRAGQRR